MFRKAKPIILALLIVQLAMGMNMAIGRTGPYRGPPRGMPCPEQAMMASAMSGSHAHPANHAATAQPRSNHHRPMSCCGSAGCQCHASPAIGTFAISGDVARASPTPFSMLKARVLPARPDELFRPPIA